MKHVLLTMLLFAAVELRADVTGAVVTPDGKPVEKARVELFAAKPVSDRLEQWRNGIAAEPLATAESDAKGNFRIDCGKRGNYVFRVSRDGFAPAGAQTTGDEDLGGLLLRPAAMKVGHVTANGKPVVNARVRFEREPAWIDVVTDEGGRYSVPDPAAWDPAVDVFHADFAPHREWKARDASSPVALDIALREGLTLRGRVLDPSGKSGAKARLFVDGVSHGESNDDGSFELRHLPSSWKQLAAVSGPLVARAERGNVRDLRLAKALTLSGSVIDTKTRLPLAGAGIALNAERYAATPLAETLTDAKGNFVIEALLPGSYTLIVQHAGYGPTLSQETLVESTARKPLHLKPQGRFTGVVSGGDRRPIAAVRVEAAPRSSNSIFLVDSSRVSAPDGRYSIAVEPWQLESRELDVVARIHGYAMTKDGPHTLGIGEQKRVDLVLSRGNTLTGRVIDRNGEPLPGVTIAAVEVVGRMMFSRPYDVKWEDEPKTDETGSFELNLRPGTYDLYFNGGGRAPKKLAGVDVRTAPDPLEVILEPAASISGRVVTSTGEPIGDLRLEGSTDGPRVLATTDQTGAFTLHGLPAGTIGVSIESEDGAIAEMRPIKAPAENVTIELTPTARLSGRVVTKDGGRPVTDFTTEIAMRSSGSSYYGGNERRQSFHDAEGRFVIERVAVRPSELIVTAPGYARARIALDPAAEKGLEDLEVQLDRGATITGRVTGPSGEPIEGARVLMQIGNGFDTYSDLPTTDTAGEYKIEGAPVGEITFSFRKPGFQQQRKTVEVKAGETRIDAQLQAGKTLAGRVVTETGAAVADATVNASSSGAGAGGAEARTDASGRFTLEGLGSGVYEVRASRRGSLDAILHDVDIDRAGELTITLRSGATITGRILGVDLTSEEALPRVGAGGSGMQVAGTVDAKGNYRIEGAPVGKVGVRAYAGGVSRRQSELAEIETENGGTYTVDLEFREHNTIRGRVTVNGAPLRSGNIALSLRNGPRGGVSALINEDGTYELRGVPSGDYNVMILNMTGEQYTVVRTITRSETIDIDVRPASVTAHVIDEATGKAIDKAEMTLQPTDAKQTPNRPRATSDSDGRVLLENISPGEYDVRVVRDGYASYLARRTFSDGVAAEFEVRLTPSAGVALTVIDGRNGKPIAASVTARNGANVIVYNGYARTRDDGSLLIPLPPGTHRLNLFSSGLGGIYVDVTSPGTHRVTMRPGGTLEFETSGSIPVRVLSADGAIYNIDPGEASPVHVVMDGTKYTDMAVGSYVVQRLDANGNVVASERVEIREGQTTKVRL